MKKIAIVFYRNFNSYDSDGYSSDVLIASRISQWTEVSDNDYQLLISSQYSDLKNPFKVILMPEDQDTFIMETVAQALKVAKAAEQKRQALKDEVKRKADLRAQAKAEKLEAKRMQEESHRRALFEELQKEFQSPKT
jgi:predicted DNA-binding protein YlxM (UPF0122 family)